MDFPSLDCEQISALRDYRIVDTIDATPPWYRHYVESGSSRRARRPAEEIVRVAADLLSTGGVAAVSTRAVADAAGVKAPTIYREFGDKSGLLDAVTVFVLRNHLRDKRNASDTPTDPLVDLRHGWDTHVDFGLAHPGCYSLIYGQPHPSKLGPAASELIAILRHVIGQLGAQGRLCMSVARATRLLHAAAVGFVLTQIAVALEERDQRLSLIARENALWSIMNDPQPSALPEMPGLAVALREALRDCADVQMTPVEGAVLAEWLDRLADQMPARDAEAGRRPRRQTNVDRKITHQGRVNDEDARRPWDIRG